MTATPALSNDIFGKYQKKISDDLYLDRNQSEGVLVQLRAFALELSSIMSIRNSLYHEYPEHYIANSDPGDEHA